MENELMERDRLLPPLLVGAGAGALCAIAALAGLFSSWSARVSDGLFTRTAPDASIVIVAIDDASMAAVGRWPWKRARHADLIRALTRADVAAIGYDVNFSEPEDAKNDDDLAEAIAASGRVILPVELRLRETADGRLLHDAADIIRPIAPLVSVAAGLGHSNIPPDVDGVVRRIPVSISSGVGTDRVPAFAYVVAGFLRRAPQVAALPADLGSRLIVRFNGPPFQTFPMISAADILSGAADVERLRGKIVFVGSTAPDLHDEQLVPTSEGVPMSGVEIHATLLDTLLRQSWLVPMPAWALALLLVAIGAFFGLLIPRVRSRWSVLVAAALWIALVIAASIAFDRGRIVSVFWTTAAVLSASAAVTVERRIASERRRRWLKGLLARYVSPSVVQEILHRPERFALGGERKRMSVLFSDIRGFTSLSEGMSPEALVRHLNAYLGRMTEIVFAHEGVLDKYVGDAVMAFWNAPLDQPDHAARACLAALDMRRALVELNSRGVFGSHGLRIGIGIHVGDMIVGNMGSEHHMDYTVIGDSVNLASRLENLTKAYGTDILISEDIRLAAGNAVFARPLDRVVVKGRSQPVRIYELLAAAGDVSSGDRARVAAYEAAFAAYFDRRFEDVIALCEVHLRKDPEDHPLRLLQEHATHLLKHPPPSDWDGTWVHD